MKRSLSEPFRNPERIRHLLDNLPDPGRRVRIMEVCGTHTMAIGRWGIRRLLPEWIELLSGPGCPVCVTPSTLIDVLAGLRDVRIAVFGDLMRVPGTTGTLEDARSAGSDIRIIYSPLEALELAREKPTVLAGIGFETTIPGMAHTLRLARKQNMNDFSMLCALKTVPAALRALLDDPESRIDGFLLPGHVSVVTGLDAFGFLPRDFNTGGVVAGFEPADIIRAISMLIQQIAEDNPKIENEYSRIVTPGGNRIALSAIEEIFQPCDAQWRGLGNIPNSGLRIRDEWRQFDAAVRYDLRIPPETGDSPCRCGDVLRGRIRPVECPLFDNGCTPASPVGPCMVSPEGSCAAWYAYERHAASHTK